MKRTLWLIIFIPSLLFAQDFEFQFEPEGIPLEVNGWQIYSAFSGGVSESVPALTDIDADGDFDFLVGQVLGRIYFYENIGTVLVPDFILATVYFDSIDIGPYRAHPCFVDLDADNDMDIVLGDDSEHVFLYRNVGTPQQPSYIQETNQLVPYPPSNWGPELVDIDADGDYDLFCGYDQITFYRNDGTPEALHLTLVTDFFEEITVDGRASTEFCDIDADGDFDLFIGDKNNATIWYYRNDGDASNYFFTFMTENFTGMSVGESSTPEFCDIDADGDYDLFVGREPNSSVDDAGDVFFYENIGTPEQYLFELVTPNFLSLDEGGLAKLDLIDIDADGDQDLFMTADYVLRLYRNVGTPTSPAFSKEGEEYQTISVNDQYPHFCDIDADGDYDLFCGSSAIPGPPGLYLYLNQGTPDSAEFTLFSEDFVPWNYWVIIYPTLADIDDDRDLDLFICDQDGNFFFFENTGDRYWPNFEWRSDNWQDIDPGNLQRCCSFFDQDDDGDLDLLFNSAPTPSTPMFYRNIGSPSNPAMVYDPTMTITGYDYYDVMEVFGFDMVDIDADGDEDFFGATVNGGCLFYRNVSDLSVLEPRLQLDPAHGIQFGIGPNPANPITWITYNIPYPQKAEIAVYNLLGQKVATLATGLQMPGQQTLIWDAASYSSGVYMVKLESESFQSVQRITVLK